MKTLYFECKMGAAGDMLAASLYELLDDEKREKFHESMVTLESLGIKTSIQSSIKCGITGSSFEVLIHGHKEEGQDWDGHHHHHDHKDEHQHDHHHDQAHHHHMSMGTLTEMIQAIPLAETIKSDAVSIYQIIAQAESQVHGLPVSEVHFHEVGQLDALADILAVCVLIDLIRPDQILASPIHVGSGHVHCAHGILPVPAPATALILEDIPIYSKELEGELCTPTGAALLKHFVSRFTPMPTMSIEKIGYGMGTKDFEVANCLRTFIGETKEELPDDTVFELRCNLDDMTGEDLAFAKEELLKAGALDVYTIAIGMKKSRPGVLLSVLCREDQRQEMAELIFRHTTSLGIREHKESRYLLRREVEKYGSSMGPVSVKKSLGYGCQKEKYEYEDIARLARKEKEPLEKIRRILDQERKMNSYKNEEEI
ncbi:nickel pincer cofactor biosynthesis protein LarC [Kallipyga massiliensis]|uniref:nickel pincer cofactor biosynthesis protein LarC n=1 Tax=Kallipyga massiliensis TaxID=1472764 RepID=UPI0004B4CBDF|nr:nickel pincer cofactor biosynthesis protein LarC [Kallipyga massiliensis]